jgi:2-oxoglutarate dehydrogenase E1 component
VLLCSGKIYYQLLQRREELNDGKIAIVRLEQFYPFPARAAQERAASYPKAESWVWVQEAPAEHGRLAIRAAAHRSARGHSRLDYVGRKPAASPATGFPNHL